MVDDFLFLQLFADTVHAAHFVPVVEDDVVGGELGEFVKAFVDLAFENVVVAVDRDRVHENQVAFQRVVVAFADLDLPGAEAVGVIEDVFEAVEVDEGAFGFFQMKVAEVRGARDFP